MKLPILYFSSPRFKKNFQRMIQGQESVSLGIEKKVLRILDSVRSRGDQALLEYTQKFDRHRPQALEVSKKEIQQAYDRIDSKNLRSLQLAARRIGRFHRVQQKKIPKSWRIKEGESSFLGEEIRSLKRVGIYVPGGLAAYPSTVLMNAIPARVAGVNEILMTTPWPDGQVNPYTLVAADLAGVNRIFRVGGAQAIAALAYGTKTIPSVDKIVGPGNIFVATAKKLVFGQVGIDMIAGPSEVVVIADESANPEFIASDLLSQAEHDPRAMALLLTSSKKVAELTQAAVANQLQASNRGKILAQSLKARGAIILTRHLMESVSLSNEIGPEHLELQVEDPEKILPKISSAGAIFLGRYSPVAMGDYVAGPNHVLPTSGNARFSSPLSVWDFIKRSSIVHFDEKFFGRLAPHVARLAHLEGLTAHEASVRLRLKK